MDTIKGTTVDSWETVMLTCSVCMCRDIPAKRLPAETIDGQAMPRRIGLVREADGLVHEWTLAEQCPGQSDDALEREAAQALVRLAIVCDDCKAPPAIH